MSKSTPRVKVKKNRLLGTKVGAKLLVAVFCSLCISLLLFGNLYLLSTWTVEKYSSTMYAPTMLSDFQEYVDKNRITSDDLSMLTAWLNKNDIKFMHIYRGDERIFDSDDPVDNTHVYDERERDYYWDNRAITFIEKIEYVEKEERTVGDTATAAYSFTAETESSASQEVLETEEQAESHTQQSTDIDSEGVPYPVPVPTEPTEGRAEEFLSFDDMYDEHITYETLNVFIAVGTDAKLLIVLLIVSVILCLIVFSLLILRFISSHVMYLTELAGEVAEIEGGMIDRSVTVRGNDEIAYLAQSVEDMRISLVERLQSEKEAYNANRELITAMSHDLRTPLSALIGYLEIIGSGVYSDEAQKEVYIRKSVEKAYQLKAMSDKLFDYFTVFKNDAQDSLNLDVYDGYELLTQMIGEQSYMLEEKGYQIVFEEEEQSTAEPVYQLQLDLDALLRVFDNIYSNIIKYADKSEPVRILLHNEEDSVSVSVSNRINRTAVKVASTKIGLKSCHRLMAKMNCTLTTVSDGVNYTVTLGLKKYSEDK